MKILVIDDDRDVRDMLCLSLEMEDCHAISAASGKKALELLNTEPMADLIVTDIVMPDMDGMELIRKLKKDFPDIRILAISGGGRGSARGYLDVAKMLGADSTLRKPFDRAQLLDAVQTLLK